MSEERRHAGRLDHETYVELVLLCVEQVPRGRVTTYGAIAEVVGPLVGGGGPRLVGSVMAAHGGAGAVVARRTGGRLAAPEPPGRGAADLPRGGHAAAALGQRRPQAGVLPADRSRVSSASRVRAAGKMLSGGVTSPAPT